MKIIIGISLFICALGIIACSGGDNYDKQSNNKENAEQNIEGAVGPEIQFDTLVNNLGKIIAGEQVLCYFKYRNSGDEPLVIYSIKAGCGCTVPEWNSEPLQPGDTDDIKVVFDSFSKRGNQNIRIAVTSNSSTPVSTLVLKAEVN